MHHRTHPANSVTCPLCGAPASIIYIKHHGYQQPASYDIYECENCDTRFASPLVSGTSSLYDLIYQVGLNSPGYERYIRYQRGVLISPDPLGFLAQREDVYWMVAGAISLMEERIQRAVSSIRILEVGSGFGYLTYALHRRGYNVQGIDISKTAVAQAEAIFGPLYKNSDIMSFSADNNGTFDIIVATEVIEHLDRPQLFMDRAIQLLKPGGSLIITTPARELYPLDYVWHTDPPPVHLWWFSKTSLRLLAWKNGVHVEFINPTPYYRSQGIPKLRSTKSAFLSDNGNVIFKDSLTNSFARWLMRRFPAFIGVIGKIFVRKMRNRRHAQTKYDISLSHCAVFTRPN